ncbi:unnamed protein product [Acanthoscelides obtectus]|uniref:Uncharacterized protein n=1 Tax=Acanthoscelides obtectus TaxID=200917 RepID=A0A9P0NTT9_ACAOB|nr:unnamed protein product [Acanthoscelides obtectus]CAK1661604.1 hypothetical protein AOBTE_LOCUS22714 [Acanthoscelides obtectus]
MGDCRHVNQRISSRSYITFFFGCYSCMLLIS